jgi:hypothetical protein
MRLPGPLAEHRTAIVLTFEIFWILVFLLEAATGGSGSQIVQFQYVNF